MFKKIGLSIFISAMASQASSESTLAEEVLVEGRSTDIHSAEIEGALASASDTADLLKLMPGANVNRNGGLTGIAQYRGMYGDQIAMSLDGASVLSGGPNAMDTALSYASPLITESVMLDRGIAAVSRASESIGGHIDVRLARGDFSDNERFSVDGMVAGRYADNGDIGNLGLRLGVANHHHRFSLLGESDRGDDFDTPAGKVVPSELARDRVDLSYGFQSSTQKLLAYFGDVKTRDSGTPALAMDIRTIDSTLAGLHYQIENNSGWTFDVKGRNSDVEHWMDNFSLRNAPANPMGYRQNYATADGSELRFDASYALSFAALNMGLQWQDASHDSTITNPNAAAFEILNFNGVERDQSSAYIELDASSDSRLWQAGLRYTTTTNDAEEIGASGLMGMMASNASMLADAFNTADREVDFQELDFVVKYGRYMSRDSRYILAFSSKARTPAYQQLYLWLPLQATGGLADGRNYVGNLELDAERANEINLGFEWGGKNNSISPQFYFRDVSDYIQGTPASNMPANMIATMMSGQPALQFNNVDAEILGVDLAWHVTFTEGWSAEGVFAFNEGKRTDVDDNLYRQSPVSSQLAILYAAGAWNFRFENSVYAKQDEVAEYNGEQDTAGYGLVHLVAQWQAGPHLNLDLRIDNIADKAYQDHLGGVNRVAGEEIAQGDRLYGAGRSVKLGAKYVF